MPEALVQLDALLVVVSNALRSARRQKTDLDAHHVAHGTNSIYQEWESASGPATNIEYAFPSLWFSGGYGSSGVETKPVL